MISFQAIPPIDVGVFVQAGVQATASAVLKSWQELAVVKRAVTG